MTPFLHTLKDLEGAIEQLEDDTLQNNLQRSQNYKVLITYLEQKEKINLKVGRRILEFCYNELNNKGKHVPYSLNVISQIFTRVKEESWTFTSDFTQIAISVIKRIVSLLPIYMKNMDCTLKAILNILESVPNDLIISLTSSHSDSVKDLFYSVTTMPLSNREQASTILIEWLKCLPSSVRERFLSDNLDIWFLRYIPTLLSNITYNNKDITQKQLELLEYIIAQLTEVDYSENTNYKLIVDNICNKDKYPAVLKSLLEEGAEVWHRLWILFVRLLKSQVTTNRGSSGTPINLMLNVVEKAFKMDSSSRCRAFECWNVLIENFSMEKKSVNLEKQLKLLFIPLKAYNTKTEDAVIAKFSTWWYLVLKFQSKMERFGNSIIISFLSFAFGRSNLPANLVPGFMCETMKKKCLHALVEIIGHVDCNGCTEITKLDKKIISPKLLVDHWSYWLYCIKIAIKFAAEDESLHKNIKCLWKGFALTIAELPDNKVRQDLVTEMLDMLGLWRTIPTVATSKNLVSVVFNVMIIELMDNRISILLNVKDEKSNDLDLVMNMLKNYTMFQCYPSSDAEKSVEKLKIITDFVVQASAKCSQCLVTKVLKDLPPNDIGLMIWTALAQSVNEQSEHTSVKVKSLIIIWPLKRLQAFEFTKYSAFTWYTMYSIMYTTLPAQVNKTISEILKCCHRDTSIHFYFGGLIIILKDSIGKNVSYSTEVDAFINVANKVNSVEDVIDLFPALLDTLILMLSNINSEVNVEKAKCAVSIVKKTMDFVNQFLTMDNNKNINILTFLSSINTFASTDAYSDLAKTIQEEVTTTLDLCDKKSLFVNVNLLCLKSLCKSNPKKVSNDGMSNVKSDVFNVPQPKNVKKDRKKTTIIDTVVENGEEYVVIKPDWKYRSKKLTESQKEKLEKNRESIPALYQDLSQSQDEFKAKWKTDSQDTSSGSKSESKNVCEDVYKVINSMASTDVVPQIMQNILSETNKDEDSEWQKIVRPPKSRVSDIKNTEDSPNVQKVKEVHNEVRPKSPRLTLKERISRNLKKIAGNVADTDKAATSQNSELSKSSTNQEITNEELSKEEKEKCLGPKKLPNHKGESLKAIDKEERPYRLKNKESPSIKGDKEKRPVRLRKMPKKYDESEVILTGCQNSVNVFEGSESDTESLPKINLSMKEGLQHNKMSTSLEVTQTNKGSQEVQEKKEKSRTPALRNRRAASQTTPCSYTDHTARTPALRNRRAASQTTPFSYTDDTENNQTKSASNIQNTKTVKRRRASTTLLQFDLEKNSSDISHDTIQQVEESDCQSLNQLNAKKQCTSARRSRRAASQTTPCSYTDHAENNETTSATNIQNTKTVKRRRASSTLLQVDLEENASDISHHTIQQIVESDCQSPTQLKAKKQCTPALLNSRDSSQTTPCSYTDYAKNNKTKSVPNVQKTKIVKKRRASTTLLQSDLEENASDISHHTIQHVEESNCQSPTQLKAKKQCTPALLNSRASSQTTPCSYTDSAENNKTKSVPNVQKTKINKKRRASTTLLQSDLEENASDISHDTIQHVEESNSQSPTQLKVKKPIDRIKRQLAINMVKGHSFFDGQEIEVEEKRPRRRTMNQDKELRSQENTEVEGKRLRNRTVEENESQTSVFEVQEKTEVEEKRTRRRTINQDTEPKKKERSSRLPKTSGTEKEAFQPSEGENSQASADFIESSQDSTSTTISLRSAINSPKVHVITLNKNTSKSSSDMSLESQNNMSDIPRNKTMIDENQSCADNSKKTLNVTEVNSGPIENTKNNMDLTENMDTEPTDGVKYNSCDVASSSDLLVVYDVEPVIVINTEVVCIDSQNTANADTEPVNSKFLSENKSQEDTDKNCVLKTTADVHIGSTSDMQNNTTKTISDSVLQCTNDESSSSLHDEARRKQDFLNNTLEISPIKTMSPVEENKSPSHEENEDYMVIHLSQPVKSNGEPISDSPELFIEDKTSPDKRDLSPPREQIALNNNSSPSLSLKQCKRQVRQIGRGAQMLGLCVPNRMQSIINAEKSSDTEEQKRSSPVNTPVRRNLKILNILENAENAAPEDSEDDETFLKFKKTLPTPDSSPAGPILKKRKLIEIADDATACKRKRVSFHDPPVSTTVAIQKYIEPGNKSPASSTVKRLDRPRPLNMKSSKKLSKTVDGFHGFTDVELAESLDLSFEQTPSVEIIKPGDLNDVDPICPNLADCIDPIQNIATELSSPAMKDLLVKELEGKIETVGDLAKMTELEINRLCIKAPKVKVAKKVLANYCTKISDETVSNWFGETDDVFEADNFGDRNDKDTNAASTQTDPVEKKMRKSVMDVEVQACSLNNFGDRNDKDTNAASTQTDPVEKKMRKSVMDVEVQACSLMQDGEMQTNLIQVLTAYSQTNMALTRHSLVQTEESGEMSTDDLIKTRLLPRSDCIEKIIEGLSESAKCLIAESISEQSKLVIAGRMSENSKLIIAERLPQSSLLKVAEKLPFSVLDDLLTKKLSDKGLAFLEDFVTKNFVKYDRNDLLLFCTRILHKVMSSHHYSP